MVLPSDLTKPENKNVVYLLDGDKNLNLGRFVQTTGWVKKKYIFQNGKKDGFTTDEIERFVADTPSFRQQQQLIEQKSAAEYASRLEEAQRNHGSMMRAEAMNRESPEYQDELRAQRGYGGRRRRSTSKRSKKKKSHTRRRRHK